MYSRNKIVFVVAVLVAFVMCLPTAQAATEAEIEQAITDGLVWLVADQEGDGSWPAFYEDVATTALAVMKLEHRAYELGYDSPFDPAYPYHQNVQDGLDYLFDATGTRLLTVSLTSQDHTGGASGSVDDPDYNGNGIGVYAHGHSYPFDVYDTGLVLSAIAASGTPNRVIAVPGSVVNGRTFEDVAQDMVDWLAWAQSDFDYAPIGMGEGGWSYGALDNDDQMGFYGPDNSNGGYAVLGLAYAEQFGCVIPAWVKTELNAYIVDIQDPVDGDPNGYDGGSWYDAPNPLGSGISPNVLKTGNLIMEMTLVGDSPATPRVVDALNYLANHWGDASGINWPPGWDGNPAQYQAMFTVMKGLEYSGIDDFNGIDWYADFADSIVSQQSGDGSWTSSSGRGNTTIITAWALLTLEKTSPEAELEVALDIKPTSCPNPLNVKPFQKMPKNAKAKKGGVLPVAILGTNEFDVYDIDVSSILLEGVAPLRHHYEDVAAPVEDGEECECTTDGPDGYMDLTLKFEKAEIVAALGEVSPGEVIPLTLTGLLNDGREFDAVDCVRILGEIVIARSSNGGVGLGPAVPNPFNPTTRLSFSLPEEAFVSLSVYDVSGRLVERLVSGVRPAGEHFVEWDAHGMVSGIYFYRLEVGDVAQTRKMILIK